MIPTTRTCWICAWFGPDINSSSSARRLVLAKAKISSVSTYESLDFFWAICRKRTTSSKFPENTRKRTDSWFSSPGMLEELVSHDPFYLHNKVLYVQLISNESKTQLNCLKPWKNRSDQVTHGLAWCLIHRKGSASSSKPIPVRSETNKSTNTFHVALPLFKNWSQMATKWGKNST